MRKLFKGGTSLDPTGFTAADHKPDGNKDAKKAVTCSPSS